MLAFCSDDCAIADRFEGLLIGFNVPAISTLRHFDELPGVACGVAFAEDNAYGEAALVAAERDGCSPWLVLAARQYPAHWWRKTTLRKQPLLWHWTFDFGEPLLLLAYRDVDPAAWRELWSHLSHDSNVAIAAVSGRVAVDALRERFVKVKTSISVDDLSHLAGHDGWCYVHDWGGGADEHYAIFFAADAATTAHVADFAQRQWPRVVPYHSYW